MLRRELSAIETYQQAIAKLEKDAKAADLRAIHAEHRNTANEFRKHVHHHGGEPDQGSGPWGVFAKAVTATAKALGANTVLEALKEGEQQGIRTYEKALIEPDWPAGCLALITGALGQCQAHVRRLEQLMAAG
jgi:hypothetical protein